MHDVRTSGQGQHSCRVALFALTAIPAAAVARTPGSEDLGEAITQIKDAKEAVRMMRAEWSFYAVIDKEGRAGNIDAARRVLGGVAPQRGEAAVAGAARHTIMES